MVDFSVQRSFFESVRAGDLRKVQVLAAAVSIEVQDGSGSTALHYAATEKRSAMVEWLLAQGASVAVTNKVGQTPLHKAVRVYGVQDKRETERVVILLLKAGADYQSLDAGKLTPLDYALKDGSDTIVSLLLGSTANEMPLEQEWSHSPDVFDAPKVVASEEKVDPILFKEHASLSDPQILMYLLQALNGLEFGRVKELLVTVALNNRASDPGVRLAYDTMRSLRLQFTHIMRDCFPLLCPHVPSDVLMRMDYWRLALILIFFHSDKTGTLTKSTFVEKLVPHAKKALIECLKEFLQELSRAIGPRTDNTSEIHRFLDPTNCAQTFKVQIDRLWSTIRVAAHREGHIFEEFLHIDQTYVPRTLRDQR
jgi:hypothetical protein